MGERWDCGCMWGKVEDMAADGTGSGERAEGVGEVEGERVAGMADWPRGAETERAQTRRCGASRRPGGARQRTRPTRARHFLARVDECAEDSESLQHVFHAALREGHVLSVRGEVERVTTPKCPRTRGALRRATCACRACGRARAGGGWPPGLSRRRSARQRVRRERAAG
ncbi:hypothetical protein C8J57DRAFT_1337471 [Mycena rebaudengoi]|nr:hypothetical protein C8J57DRAFT_1337471 [Mycena rebaudengoi]